MKSEYIHARALSYSAIPEDYFVTRGFREIVVLTFLLFMLHTDGVSGEILLLGENLSITKNSKMQ